MISPQEEGQDLRVEGVSWCRCHALRYAALLPAILTSLSRKSYRPSPSNPEMVYRGILTGRGQDRAAPSLLAGWRRLPIFGTSLASPGGDVHGGVSRNLDNEEDVMNKDVLQGKWKEMKGKVKEQWGKLTDDDLDRIDGKSEQLLGLLQQRYGYARDKAEEEYKRFNERWSREGKRAQHAE